MDTSEDEATKQLKGLAVSSPIPTKRKVGEDVFTEACVKTWQMPRIKAWESRYVNPEGYYFRFVIPGEGQRNGGWTPAEHKQFMDRYHEWLANGWKIGFAWGLFSKKIPHRVGYQCMNYYRKLVGDNKIKDSSYAVVDGKLKQVQKDRGISGTPSTSKLGEEWESEQVKEIERNVDRWLKEYHRRSGTASTSVARTRQPAAPRVPRTPTIRKPISDMVKKMPPPRQPLFILDDDDDDEDAMDVLLNTQEPEHANLHIRKHDYEKELRERLEAYNKFMQPFLDPISRREYWTAKQEWRRGLTTTEM
ncbi:hypothetical protein K492DRAFT_132181 [Lichtheimia hyalospora FSU 10163]|nr:hypothetical protein K492DRAFT_132181 [Lichtheimia hyalospora FSU 10163]